MTALPGRVRLWSDEPSAVDLLAFTAVARTVVDAVLDDALDPLALGISGRWGSGKTTVLQLVEQELNSASDSESNSRVLVVRTDPWRYDPAVGAKESLIAEVLDALAADLNTSADARNNALGLLKKLTKRVDWAKAVKVAARTSLTLQLPSLDDLTSLIREAGSDDDGSARGLDEFRDEFADLMASDELAHVKRVAVLVDDLDRCLPDTVIETLETIRLFLAVPKMSFVLAADEDRVADAIRTRYPAEHAGVETAPEEEAAKLYLHKIVQTTIPLPGLSRFDTEAYLFLLQLQNGSAVLTREQFTHFLSQCSDIRLKSGDLDELVRLDGIDINEALTFAARLTPLLYEKLRGNPRRIKRFLNDMHVRQSIAARRGIELDKPVIAKLMVLEVLLPDEFKRVLEWLAHGELRQRIALLEKQAGRAALHDDRSADKAEGDSAASTPVGAKAVAPAKKAASKSAAAAEQPDATEDTFSDNFIRWAKLPPELRPIDLSPYLTLAASFRGQALLDRDLPERLRDLASNLLSSVRAEQKSVNDDDLRSLTPTDASLLVGHLGRAARDRPTEQRAAVVGLLRITRLHATAVDEAARLLGAIAADDVQPAVVLSFTTPDVNTFRSALDSWLTTVSDGPTKTALTSTLSSGGGS